MKHIEIEEYKAIVLRVLIKIDEICRNNNLKYMLMYGSLLGAVRHEGFIPWDDDIDIVMPREDYYKLMTVINESANDLAFISIENNPDTIYPYGKVCDINTTAKEKNFRQVKGYGAFVDVFPLDYMPNGAKERRKYCRRCRRLMIWITHSSRTGFDPGHGLKTRMLRYFAFRVSRLMNTQKLIKNLNNQLEEFNRKNGQTSYIGIPWGYNAENLYPAKLFEETTELEFEGHRFYAPEEYDAVLKMRYGDYMKLPPEKERVYAHSIDCYLNN